MTAGWNLRDRFSRLRADGGAGVSVTEPYGYTGHAEDGHGLVWGLARWLDVGSGVWLREDPVATELRYCYGEANPLAVMDPTGTVVVINNSKAKSIQFQVLNRTFKVAIHPKHHHWNLGRKLFCIHFEVMSWVAGAKGGHIKMQVPLPLCSRTRKTTF